MSLTNKVQRLYGPQTSGGVPPVDNGGDPPDDGDMEKRLSNLEIRFDTVLPTLSTRSDIADIKGAVHELRGDMHKAESTLVKFVVGCAIAMVTITISVMTFVVNNAAKQPLVPTAQKDSSPAIIINVPTPVQPAAQLVAPQPEPQKPAK